MFVAFVLNIIYTFAVKPVIIDIIAMIEAFVTEPSLIATRWILNASPRIWILTVGV